MKDSNIMKTGIVLVALILFISCVRSAHAASAGDITLSLDQKDYYFKTGENAAILLKSNNTYGKDINGLLSYTITQSINQGNFQFSSSNTQSTSFSITAGNTEHQLDFGKSDSPATLSVDMKFLYDYGNESREVDINELNIHFVSDDSQVNNQQSQISSSSQETQTNSQQTDPFAQQEQRMQEEINQMMNNNQQPSKNSQQAVQNNQLDQDSSALKNQMEQQIEEQQQMKEEFQKQLAKNKDFQQAHQELLNQGYNLTNGNINPTSNNTGDFELDYQNQNGQQASLKGSMQDGKLTSLQQESQEQKQKIID